MSEHNCDVLILGEGDGGTLDSPSASRERPHKQHHRPGQRIRASDSIASGRNSGVLHAGLYYKPGSLKAKVCVEGARRLRDWVEERGLPLNPCGKVIVPPRAELDAQLRCIGRARQGKWRRG